MTTIKMIQHRIKSDNGIYVYGLSDLHIGSREFEEGLFNQFVRSILKEENRYCVIVGDVIDNGTKNSVTGPYGATMQPREQRKYAEELLYPLKDRILGMVGGNHERRAAKESDADPAELIAERLDIWERYRSGTAFIQVDLGQRKNGEERAPKYCIAISHGTSGGALMGAGLNKADQFAIASGADLVIMGHSHKPASAPASRLICMHENGVMVQRDYAVMICTAWLSYGGYPLDMALKPLPIAPNRAWLNGERHEIEIMQKI